MIFFVFAINSVKAQKDLLIKKDSTTIRCKILKITPTEYAYAFVDTANKISNASILINLVDSIQYNKYDSNLVVNKIFNKKKPLVITDEVVEKPYQFTIGIGLNLGNILEFNSSSGPDKKSFSATSALDLGLNYYKETNRFAMTNELHWTIAIQKSGLSNGSHIQRATDDINTLHDFSYAINKSNKWSIK